MAVCHRRSYLDPCTNYSHGPEGVLVRPSLAFDTPSATADGLNPLGPLERALTERGWRMGQDLMTHAYDWRWGNWC